MFSDIFWSGGNVPSLRTSCGTFVSGKYLRQLAARDVNSEIFHRFRPILPNAPIHFCTYFRCMKAIVTLDAINTAQILQDNVSALSKKVFKHIFSLKYSSLIKRGEKRNPHFYKHVREWAPQAPNFWPQYPTYNGHFDTLKVTRTSHTSYKNHITRFYLTFPIANITSC